MHEAELKMKLAERFVFMGTSFSVNITSIALRYALQNNAQIEIVDPEPIDLNIDNIKYHKMTASEYVLKYSCDAVKIGVTGPPGSGKSSLINMLIPKLRSQNLSVGVIAIDPSSPITGGSFLGDRVRMKNAIDDKNVFVRSMGSRAELGGITELAEDFSDIIAFLSLIHI